VAEGAAVLMRPGNAGRGKGPHYPVIPSTTRKGKDEMIKASISLQDLRRRIYIKAKSEPEWRFWGLFVHACKMETLEEAYKLAKENNGATGNRWSHLRPD